MGLTGGAKGMSEKECAEIASRQEWQTLVVLATRELRSRRASRGRDIAPTIPLVLSLGDGLESSPQGDRHLRRLSQK